MNWLMFQVVRKFTNKVANQDVGKLTTSTVYF